MTSAIRKFCRGESGAVSADWVAITAAGMLLAAAIAAIVNNNTVAAGQQLGQNVAALGSP